MHLKQSYSLIYLRRVPQSLQPIEYVGNIRFRKEVKKAMLLSYDCSEDKMAIARKIVSIIHLRNGRFLRRLHPGELNAALESLGEGSSTISGNKVMDGGASYAFVVVSNKAALEKTKQCMRYQLRPFHGGLGRAYDGTSATLSYRTQKAVNSAIAAKKTLDDMSWQRHPQLHKADVHQKAKEQVRFGQVEFLERSAISPRQVFPASSFPFPSLDGKQDRGWRLKVPTVAGESLQVLSPTAAGADLSRDILTASMLRSVCDESKTSYSLSMASPLSGSLLRRSAATATAPASTAINESRSSTFGLTTVPSLGWLSGVGVTAGASPIQNPVFADYDRYCNNSAAIHWMRALFLEL